MWIFYFSSFPAMVSNLQLLSSTLASSKFLVRRSELSRTVSPRLIPFKTAEIASVYIQSIKPPHTLPPRLCLAITCAFGTSSPSTAFLSSRMLPIMAVRMPKACLRLYTLLVRAFFIANSRSAGDFASLSYHSNYYINEPVKYSSR